jgi:anti-sigma factor RsiW
MSGSCLGTTAAALVDGELDHEARERAQRHLAHCGDCRAEVDAQRRLKATLSGLSPAPAPAALAARLMALQVPGTDRMAAAPSGPVRPVTIRAASGPGRTRGPGRPRALRRRATAGSAVVALGVVALALGGPQPTASTPVDPGTDSFVVQHVETTNQPPRIARARLSGGGTRNAR